MPVQQLGEKQNSSFGTASFHAITPSKLETEQQLSASSSLQLKGSVKESNKFHIYETEKNHS